MNGRRHLNGDIDRTIQVLEGWNVKESTVVNEWKAEGALETRRNDILRLLELKFPGQVLVDCTDAVEAQADPDELFWWIDVLFTSSTPEEFRIATGIGRKV